MISSLERRNLAMTPTEEKIIALIKQKASTNEIWDLFNDLLSDKSIGEISEVFVKHPTIRTYVFSRYVPTGLQFIQLRLFMEDYLIHKNDSKLAQEKLKSIEEALQNCMREVIPEYKDKGLALLPQQLANRQFMEGVYSLNDENLSAIFLKYLPAPRPGVFKYHSMPKLIAEREKISTQMIRNVLARNENKLNAVEQKITQVQRKFRAKKRRREELARIPFRYRSVNVSLNAEEVLADANKPYHPQCSPVLAKRLMNAAKEVKLFSTVKHLTHPSALESIFNDGIYGRRTLLAFYMHFSPASLYASDIGEGDGNVICMGPQHIDSLAAQGIELEFDVNKIVKNNPTVFYKQRDMHFYTTNVREAKVGDLNLYFTHTDECNANYKGGGRTVFRYLDAHQQLIEESAVFNSSLVSYNIKQMHQILTLNFFRFVDGFSSDSKNKIYHALEKLNDEELIKALHNIGTQLTDTMEFNFYGAYKIDFSALLSIKIRICLEPYVLNLADFIKELNAGNRKKLAEAMEQIPGIFSSYRFIDYLLTQTQHETIVAALREQRRACNLPSWLDDKKMDFKKN